MNTDRTCLFDVSYEITIKCNSAFLPSFIQRYKFGLQASFGHILQNLRRCTSSELENRCPTSKFFIRGKSHLGRDRGNTLVVQVPDCDVLTSNLTPGGTCELAPYRDRAFTI
ncbi:hypothetical protein AVEN_2978-1 [Araneus ventricosus]|uniref:Uncharacterized protein n=1 Tax=Araneus ventricosus TaxID=182803 RepID=A0A4Y2PSJ2_ARAVE|nr:hypothetical protein AVEN_2978-1 [Araneus ventricosus]